MEYVPFGASDKIKLSIAIVTNLICVPTRNGKRCSEQDAIKFMMMCQARALNPFEGDAFLIGYDNKDGGATYSLITAHQAFLKRAELNAQYDGMESGIIYRVRDGDEDKLIERQGDFFEDGEDVVGGWAKVYFKNRSKPMYKRLRMSRFKKGFGIWMEDAAGMIVKCAEADALRSAFPTMLGGLYMREEVDEKSNSTMNSVTPVFATVEAPAPAPPAPEPPKEDKPETAMDKVKSLCESSKISMQNLIQILIEKGIAPDGCDVDDLEDNPEVLDYIIAKWDEITKKKGETNGKKGKDGNAG